MKGMTLLDLGSFPFRGSDAPTRSYSVIDRWQQWGLPQYVRIIPEFDRITIPRCRRIYPQLIANKIVSVQPLLGPTGLVHYLRWRYSQVKHSGSSTRA